MSLDDTVFVTGGNGFIGRHLVKRLLKNGNGVICLVRSGRNIEFQDFKQPGLEIVAVDEFSDGALASAVGHRKFGAVFHLAAYGVRPTERDPRLMADVNVRATARLVELAVEGGCERFIMTGSSAEYAPAAVFAPIPENSPLETRGLYGASKAAASLLVSALCSASGMRFAVVRMFNVFGPGEAAHRLLPTIATRVAAGERAPLSLGSQLRDFVYVDDAVDALLAAAAALTSNTDKSGIYNCASGVGTTVRRFAELVGEACGARPDQLGFGDVAMRSGELPYLVGDPTALQHATGWKPHWELADAVRHAVAAVSGK